MIHKLPLLLRSVIKIKSDQEATRRCLFTLIGLLLTITCSCKVSFRPGYIAEDKRAVDKAISTVHQRMNAQEYKKVYDDANPSLKASQTESDFADQMKKIRETLGEVKYVSDKWINVVVGPSIEIRAVYNSTFDKGDATEMFNFVRDGDAIRLHNYRVYPGTQKLDNPSWHYTEGTTDEGVKNSK